MENMKIYDAVRTVPTNAQKTISAGRLKGMTDINPMWRISKLTEIFGPCGIGWWYEITDKRIVNDEITKQSAAFIDILLFYVDPESGAISHGIPGTGGSSFVAQERNGPYLSDECFKMAMTDAISVAAKAIGVGADVYWSAGRSKYSENAKEPQQFVCENCGTVLAPYKNDKGIEIGVRRHAQASKNQFDRVLCIDCIRKMQEQAQ